MGRKRVEPGGGRSFTPPQFTPLQEIRKQTGMLRSRLALLFALLLTVVDCGGRAPDSGPSRPNDLNEASRKEVEQLVHAADAAHKVCAGLGSWSYPRLDFPYRLPS